MEIKIFDGHIKTSDAQRDYITGKLQRIVDRLSNPATSAEVRLVDLNATKGGVDKQCSIVVVSSGRPPLRVEAQATDYYAAIDAASATLVRLVSKTLEREKVNGPRQ